MHVLPSEVKRNTRTDTGLRYESLSDNELTLFPTYVERL